LETNQIFFYANIWVCPHLTQIWVKTTQHCLECSLNGRLTTYLSSVFEVCIFHNLWK